jgi:hypothetical protein
MTREEAFAELVRRYRLALAEYERFRGEDHPALPDERQYCDYYIMPFGPLVWMDTSTNTQRLDWDAAFAEARRQVAIGVRP